MFSMEEYKGTLNQKYKFRCLKCGNIFEDNIKRTWDFMFELYSKNLVKANHDVNKGGFIITIAEMCFKNRLGAQLDLREYKDETNFFPVMGYLFS